MNHLRFLEWLGRRWPQIVGGSSVAAGVAVAVYYGERSSWWAQLRAKRLVKQPVALLKLRPDPRVLWVNKRFEKLIAVSLVECTAGVWLLDGGFGVGKSTATRHALRDLQNQGLIGGAVVVDCEDLVQIMSEDTAKGNPSLALRRQLYHEMRIPTSTCVRRPLSALFASMDKAKRVVVVLDQFELLKNAADKKDLHNMVKGLAQDAAQGSDYIVLINVADEELAKRMKTWNGNEKITAILKPGEQFEWTPEELKEVLDRYRKYDPRLKDLSDPEAAEILKDCKTPGNIVTRRDEYVRRKSTVEIKDCESAS